MHYFQTEGRPRKPVARWKVKRIEGQYDAAELEVRTSEQPQDEGYKPRPARCPICRASIMVRRNRKLKDSLLRALALADHVRVLHPSVK